MSSPQGATLLLDPEVLNQSAPYPQVHSDWRPRKAPDPETPATFPVADPQTPLAKQARELLAAWEKRAAYVRTIREKVDERRTRIGELEAEYHEEVRLAAEEGRVSTKDEALLVQIRSFGPELRDVWDPRLHEAIELARDAAGAYYQFIDTHGPQLVEELEPAARRFHAEYQREISRAQERLAKLSEQRQRYATASRHFLAGTRPFTATDVPDDPSLPPLPTEDAWDRYRAANPG